MLTPNELTRMQDIKLQVLVNGVSGVDRSDLRWFVNLLCREHMPVPQRHADALKAIGISLAGLTIVNPLTEYQN